MHGIFIRICQFVALLIIFGLGAWLLERAYTGMTRHHRPNRTSHLRGRNAQSTTTRGNEPVQINGLP